MAKTVRLSEGAGRVALPDGRVYETGATSEIRVIYLPDGVTGTYTLTHNGHTTGDIRSDAPASDVQDALVALAGIGPGDVTVYRGYPEMDDTFPQTAPDYEALLPLVIESDVAGFTDYDLTVDSDDLSGTARVQVQRERRTDETVDVVLTDEEFDQISPSAFGGLLTDVTE